MLEVKMARTQQLIDIAKDYITVERRKGEVSKRIIRKLEGSRQTLESMYSDEDFRMIAAKTLDCVDNMLIYIETKEQRFLDAAIVAHHESDALIYELMAESGEDDRV